jgi:stage II sporulation protein D
MPLATASAKLGALVKGRFKGIKVVTRGASPRIVKALVVGTGGTTTVTGADLQQRFSLRDTWMSFNAATAEVEAPDDGATTDTTTTPAATTTAPATTTTPPKTGGATSSGGATVGLRTRAGAGTHPPITRPRVTGSAFPARPGTPVVLQRRVGSRWVRAGATHLGTTRRYKVALPGPGRYRIVVGDAPGPIVALR